MVPPNQPSWQGLLKWSTSHSDGTSAPRQISEEDRKWFSEAMQAQTVDVVKRMKEITMVMSTPSSTLEEQGITVEELEGMLEELQEHVESIDMANDLKAIGGLAPLLGYLKSPAPSLRARAAEVLATMVQNNPRSQADVIAAGGLEALTALLGTDEEALVRTKALGAVSSLIRHNKVGREGFRLSNGYTHLRNALSSGNARLQRKALQVLHYLVQEGGAAEGPLVAQMGLPRGLAVAVGSNDADVRAAALSTLVEVARSGPGGLEACKAADGEGGGEGGSPLRQALTDRAAAIQELHASGDDLQALREERQALDVLWHLLYKEASPLREQGLVVMAADHEDGPPPDVLGPRGDPLLRAAACGPSPTASNAVSAGGLTSNGSGPAQLGAPTSASGGGGEQPGEGEEGGQQRPPQPMLLLGPGPPGGSPST